MGMVTLSGGEFGGAVVEWPEGQSTHTIFDDTGAGWIYDRARHPGEDKADFVGMAQE